MNVLRETLKEIQNGKTTFQPISRSESDMRGFQPIAKILSSANNKGLLESFFSHKETETYHNWYDIVIVKGGLSHKGEQYLTEIHNKNAKRKDDIIQLKPSIYGIGIDLKALWRHVENHWNNTSNFFVEYKA